MVSQTRERLLLACLLSLTLGVGSARAQFGGPAREGGAFTQPSGDAPSMESSSEDSYLPDDILYRPKQGFVTPIAQWFRGPLAGTARAIGDSAALGRTGWFDAKRISEMAGAHIAGRSDHSRLLWQLVMLDRSLSRLGCV